MNKKVYFIFFILLFFLVIACTKTNNIKNRNKSINVNNPQKIIKKFIYSLKDGNKKQALSYIFSSNAQGKNIRFRNQIDSGIDSNAYKNLIKIDLQKPQYSKKSLYEDTRVDDKNIQEFAYISIKLIFKERDKEVNYFLVKSRGLWKIYPIIFIGKST